MEYQKLSSQMINFNKTMFQNTFTGITVLQDLSENMTNGFLNQFPWVTEENKKPLSDTLKMMKKGRDDYRKLVEDGFDSLEKMSSEACK